VKKSKKLSNEGEKAAEEKARANVPLLDETPVCPVNQEGRRSEKMWEIGEAMVL